MSEPTTIRVLLDPPLDGPTNMARDESLLTHVGTNSSPSTLRLYQWSPATISLGYFQRIAEYEKLPPPAGTLPVVRRLTGGGAILHDQELTYSLALPIDHPLLGNRPNRLYELVHEAVIACLGDIGVNANRAKESDDSGPRKGPFFCFGRRHCFDVVVDEHKIAGSAQRRNRQAVLQHGSIVLGNRYPQQPTASLSASFDPDRIAQVRSAFLEQVEVALSHQLISGDWSPSEQAMAETLTGKYAGNEWTRRM